MRERVYIIGFNKNLFESENGMEELLKYKLELECGNEWIPMEERERINEMKSKLSYVDEALKINKYNCGLMNWNRIMSSGQGINTTVRDILQKKEEYMRPSCISNSNINNAYTINYTLTESQWNQINSPEFILKSNRYPSRCPEGNERIIDLDGKSPTITSGYHNVHSFATKYIQEEADTLPRFLTPRECARCMGFPESYKFPDETLQQLNLSYGQIGKYCGVNGLFVLMCNYIVYIRHR